MEMEMLVEHRPPPPHHPHYHQQDPAATAAAGIDSDKLSYEIFSILESKFLFGYDDDDGRHHHNYHNHNNQRWAPKPVAPSPDPSSEVAAPAALPSAGVIKNQRGKVCILSIDGGTGIRGGVLAGKALAYLEKALKTRSGDPDARISDYFDVAAGTGIGGIFTAMLFAADRGGGEGDKGPRRPLYQAEETWRSLSDHGRLFFLPSRRRRRRGRVLGCFYGGGGGEGECVAAATRGAEQWLKGAFGAELTLRDTVKPVLIPCYDLRSSAPLLFSRADALEAESFDFRLWEVCRATAAEPGKFEPVDMSSIDGATRCLAVDGCLAMSNPTAAAITHVLHNKQEFPFVRGVEDLMVLSLGTGGNNAIPAGRPSTSVDIDEVRRWKAEEWMQTIGRIASDSSADVVDHAVAMAFCSSRSSGNYVRIQDDRSGGATGDGGDVEGMVAVAEEMLKQRNVESMLFGGRRIGESTNSEKLDWFAGELVQEHQLRSHRIAPTVAFKQAPAAATPKAA